MDQSGRGQGSVRTIAMLGNHLPRHCGIATFTTDLTQAIVSEIPEVDCFVLAMNDPGVRHAYPPRVRFEIPEGDVSAYRRAADFLNVNAVDVLSVQHEYGIFGAQAGANVLELLRELRMPIVSTLHTILEAPNPMQRGVMDALIALSRRVVVMSTDGADLLQRVHGVAREKIDVIPHGIPVVPERRSKDKVGVEGRPVILTFGLLSPDKGIEHVIDAMPAILAKHPTAVYIVLGATHPHVKQGQGETYRHMLESRAERLGVSENVIFHNRFVSHEELVEFLSAADVYITPYLKEEQSTSGTLAYAIGCGKAVISTPYRYARELLDEGRGILVPWRDAAAVAREIIGLLDDPTKRAALQQRAADFGKGMSWPSVARSYMQSFERARKAHDDHRRAAIQAKSLTRRAPALPEIDLSHLRMMTDDTGILQHATFSIPRYQDGYCTDDNARALLLMALVEEEGNESPAVVRPLSTRYLAFMNHALDEQGRFRNFLEYSRVWRDEPSSDDSHGRALWGLGTVVGRSSNKGRVGLAARLFHAALPACEQLGSPRAWAYALLGIHEYLRAYRGDSAVESISDALALKLLERFHHSRTEGWPWFEDRLTYCNARLPQALLVASTTHPSGAEMRRVGVESLEWLSKQCRETDGTFSPIGSNGFHVRGGERARFDQQPVEACAMVSACIDAHTITGEARFADHARRAFDWFLGQNALRTSVFDATTGGCRDGIHADRMNENQGAESTLSYLISVAEMRAAHRVASKLVGPALLAKARPDSIAAVGFAKENNS